MVALTQLTLDGDGTIAGAIRHDGGTSGSFYTHCNDSPDGLSNDWVGNDATETDGTANFTLTAVDADFGSMDTLNIDVDVDATGFDDDDCVLTAQIFSADAGGGTALTAATATLADKNDTTRVQRNVSFGSLTGTKAQWDGAYIRFTWDYTKTGAPDNGRVHLFGCDIDGTYTVAASGVPIPVAMNHYARRRRG